MLDESHQVTDLENSHAQQLEDLVRGRLLSFDLVGGRLLMNDLF